MRIIALKISCIALVGLVLIEERARQAEFKPRARLLRSLRVVAKLVARDREL
jgi:hypothetical protein